MQNFVNFFSPTIKTNNAFYIPGGDAKVSFVDVRDIVAVADKVLTEHDEEIIRSVIAKELIQAHCLKMCLKCP